MFGFISNTMLSSYARIGFPVRHEIEIKRSRFIADLISADTEVAARAHHQALRKEFPDARHHCTAMIIGPTGQLRRSNDDGEPSGTAGAPMLEALTHFSPMFGPEEVGQVSDVSAVVVRYFGGTLLGAGGLVRAYSQAVTDALVTARWVRRQLLHVFRVQLGFAESARVENVLRTHGFAVRPAKYSADGVELQVCVDPVSGPAELASVLGRETGGAVRAESLREEWTDVQA